jgi:hypothetical protein
MATTPTIQPGEFAGRIGTLLYIGAPNGRQLAERDPLVKLRQARARWSKAVGKEAGVILPEGWEGLHTPTPERPKTILEVLRVIVNG